MNRPVSLHSVVIRNEVKGERQGESWHVTHFPYGTFLYTPRHMPTLPLVLRVPPSLTFIRFTSRTRVWSEMK